MKLPVLILLTIFLVNSECRWLPPIFDRFANTTTQFTDFVKQRSYDIKKYYTDNVQNKINSYISSNKSDEKSAERNQQTDTSGEEIDNLLKHKRFVQQHVSSTEPENDIDNNIPQFPETTTKCLADDPMVYMTTPQLIARYGYPAESHTVLTDDGYLLTLHRIPFRNRNGTKEDRRRTALLHHGLLGSSADWVIPGPGKALAFILSDAGYDVWMANVRGNTYSRSHISRPVDSYEFWDFSFHEVSQHDLPAIIDYIMEVKGWDVKINYIGHSMGTTVLFALLSTKPHYNKVLRAGYALAPVAYMTDIKSPIKILAPFANNIEYLMKLLGANEFLPQNAIIRWLARLTCELNQYEEEICENSVFVICGHDSKEFNRTLLPIILSHDPAGASTKTMIHYAQIIHNSGRFQQFDYGADKNKIVYGSVVPPEYPLHRITLPIALLSAQNDWLAGDADVSNLYAQLANPIEHYIVPMKEFNHVDFLWAIHAPKLVYNKLIKLLEDGVSIHSYYNPEVLAVVDLNLSP